uniref:ZP domain-containing protein n=1 Tax=Ditylenchus dipsaci TaxID=166011 RepID=A0A915E5H9_9BILA
MQEFLARRHRFLDIITTLPFNGHIFVKGRAKDSSCKQSYAHTGKNQTNAYSLPLGKCGMQRLRSANPRGINFGITVVVSFHPDGFITKNDRAFHVRCFYMEPDEVVTSSLEVSQLPTLQVSDSMAMPTCEYSVHSGSVDGPSLTYANVGETLSLTGLVSWLRVELRSLSSDRSKSASCNSLSSSSSSS